MLTIEWLSNIRTIHLTGLVHLALASVHRASQSSMIDIPLCEFINLKCLVFRAQFAGSQNFAATAVN